MKPDYPRQPSSGIATLYETHPHLLDDPNEFIPFILSTDDGNPINQVSLHRELQLFLSQQSRALVELPRDHGKTTQVCARILWELARNPSLRIKIVCATDAIARERGRFLRDQIESNPRLHSLCPALEPDLPWSVESFTVVRPAGVIGSSVAVFGIGAGATGTRADLLICDDIVDVKAMYGRADRERVKADFENNLLNLLEPDGRFWGLSTPWHRDDLNAFLKKNSAYAVFHRAIDAQLTPIWPEKWSREALIARRDEIGEAAFARGYHLLPVSETDVLIRPEQVKSWMPPEPMFESIVIAIDPAVSSRTTADATGIVVLGKAGTTVYCLDAKAHRVKLPDLLPMIESLDQLWQPTTILVEANAAFKGICDLMKSDVRYGPKVVGQPARNSKESRIQNFSVRVDRKQFLLRGTESGEIDPKQKALFEEMTSFPFGEHDDLVDAAAAGTEFMLGTREMRIWAVSQFDGI